MREDASTNVSLCRWLTIEHPIDRIEISISADGGICDNCDLGSVDRTLHARSGVRMRSQKVKPPFARRPPHYHRLQVAICLEMGQQRCQRVRVIAGTRHVARSELVGFVFLFARETG